MRKDFANAVAGKLNIERNDLVEKDIILHQLLLDLSKDRFFSRNFSFKGGTCLIKCYFGYKRFSEDIDFTWKDQRAFEGKARNRIRRYLSDTIDTTGGVFERIAKQRGFEFKCRKNDRNFVELGGSNKSCTFKLWYESEILGRRSFIKVQINFVEELCSRLRMGIAKSLLTKEDPQLRALFPEYREYSSQVSLSVYDVREILSEKVRALLTRRGTKARDFVDVYLISKEYGFRPGDVEKCIVKKVKFATELYARFRANLEGKLKLLKAGRVFEWGEERDLLLEKIDEDDFYSFLRGFEAFLGKLVSKL